MSRRRLTARLTDATLEIKTLTTQMATRSWPGDLVDATAPLRHITTATATIANRLHQAALQLTELAHDNTYPHAVGDAASALPARMTGIGEHCRSLDRAWKSLAADLTNVLSLHTPRGAVSGLFEPLATADADMTAAVTATNAPLWPIDCVEATRALDYQAQHLATLTTRMSTALRNNHIDHPALDSAQGWLSRIGQHYRAIAPDWAAASTELDAIERIRKTLPSTESGWPAITL